MVHHAAAAVPGGSAARFRETPYVAVALVETSPAGGDFGAVQETEAEIHLAIATTVRGLVVAGQPIPQGACAGSEGGHVRLAIANHGPLDLSTDGIGLVPCFWAEYRGQLYLSTHLASMISLGLPPDADTPGVLQYLVMFHPLAQRTILQDVRLLPAGGHLRWAPGVAASLHARPLFVPSGNPMTDDEALTTFREVWATVIRDVFDRNAGNRAVLGLSGGLDSRAIATASAGLGIRPMTYTYGDDGCHETAVATRVANRLEFPHLVIPVTDDRLLARADGIAGLLDGAHGPAEMYESWFIDVLRSFADVVVNGLAGGPLWGDDKALGLLNQEDAIRHTSERYAGDTAAVLAFLNVGAEDLALTIRSAIADSMSRWDFSARADTAVYWRLANRQNRWGNMLGSALRRDGLRLETPFLDSRFLQFAARLTPSQRMNGRLYLRVHREVLARTADIGRSDDGNSPRNLSHVYWSGEFSYATQLVRLTARHPIAGARRASRRSFEAGAERLRHRSGIAGPADRLAMRSRVFPADAWLRCRPAYANRLADLLERSLGTHPILSDDAITLAVPEIRDGNPPAPAASLSRLATVGLWFSDFSARAAAVRALNVRNAPDGELRPEPQ